MFNRLFAKKKSNSVFNEQSVNPLEVPHFNDDLFYRIFFKLDYYQLAQVMMVCTRFYDVGKRIVDSPKYWEREFQFFFPTDYALKANISVDDLKNVFEERFKEMKPGERKNFRQLINQATFDFDTLLKDVKCDKKINFNNEKVYELINLLVMYSETDNLQYLYELGKKQFLEQRENITNQNKKQWKSIYIDGKNILHWAVCCGQLEEVKAYLPEIPVDARVCDGVFFSNTHAEYTPLQLAAKFGYAEVAELLIKMNANVNGQQAVREYAPLHLAAINDHIEVVKVLIENKADLNIRYRFSFNSGDEGHSPLGYAYTNNNLEIIKILLKAGAKDYDYPIHWYSKDVPLLKKAIDADEVDVVRIFLEHDIHEYSFLFIAGLFENTDNKKMQFLNAVYQLRWFILNTKQRIKDVTPAPSGLDQSEQENQASPVSAEILQLHTYAKSFYNYLNWDIANIKNIKQFANYEVFQQGELKDIYKRICKLGCDLDVSDEQNYSYRKRM